MVAVNVLSCSSPTLCFVLDLAPLEWVFVAQKLGRGGEHGVAVKSAAI